MRRTQNGRAPVPRRKRHRARLSGGDEERETSRSLYGPVSSLRRTRASETSSVRPSVGPSVARRGNTNYKAYSTGAFREMTGIESSPAVFGAAPALSATRLSSIYDWNTEVTAAILGLVSPSSPPSPPPSLLLLFVLPFLSLPLEPLPSSISFCDKYTVIVLRRRFASHPPSANVNRFASPRFVSRLFHIYRRRIREDFSRINATHRGCPSRFEAFFCLAVSSITLRGHERQIRARSSCAYMEFIVCVCFILSSLSMLLPTGFSEIQRFFDLFHACNIYKPL